MDGAPAVGRSRRSSSDEHDAGSAQWRLWGTHARIVVTDPGRLPMAERLVAEYLTEVERACSRFREDSEITALGRAHGYPMLVSPLLAQLITTACTAAERTDGDVDPTVGAALIELGYDRDFAKIDSAATPIRAVFTQPASWSMISIENCSVTVPAGVTLDLGATAKAVAADHCARLVFETLSCGVLVSLGGDIATAGDAPNGGWHVLVQDGPGEPACQITLPAGKALATSSTQKRSWMCAGHRNHHIVDPRTGYPAESVWRTVTVAAESCLDANTVSTACVVRGHRAPQWLEQIGLPARLVDRDRQVRTLGSWPEDPRRAA